MSLETAKQIITSEIDLIEETEKFDGLSINLFGGEPLLQFDLIKNFCEWLWALNTKVKYALSITSNGTLLTDDKKAWFKQHKDKISLSLSIDGNSSTQLLNRGVSIEEIPVEFARKVWPNVHFLMTVSPEAVGRYAEDFISLTKKGYKLDAGHATGYSWPDADVAIYEKQLSQIASFYLNNSEYSPNPFFMHSFTDQLADRCDYFCGAGHHMVAYDYSGKSYPCHMFTPLVWGRDMSKDIADVDFERPLAGEKDPECETCSLAKCCPTCISYNLQERGKVSLRDKRECKILAAEIRVISSFQIQYYMRKKNSLTREEQIKLKSAVAVYRLAERRF